MIKLTKKELVERTFKEIERKRNEFFNNPENSADFYKQLIELIKSTTHLDLSNYRKNYLTRRLMHRLSQLNIESYRYYIQFLKQNPQEFGVLKDCITINTTEFFRDCSPFAYLENILFKKIAQNKHQNQKIRILSAPCSSGEEPYTLAMILNEMRKEGKIKNPIEIYACDIEQNILIKAKRGKYHQDKLKNVPMNYKRKYFSQVDDLYYEISEEIKKSVTFFHQNLLNPLPSSIPMMDLILCRNLLIYIPMKRQKTILQTLKGKLQKGSYLMLGKTESLLIFNPKGFINEEAREHIYRYV